MIVDDGHAGVSHATRVVTLNSPGRCLSSVFNKREIIVTTQPLFLYLSFLGSFGVFRNIIVIEHALDEPCCMVIREAVAVVADQVDILETKC